MAMTGRARKFLPWSLIFLLIFLALLLANKHLAAATPSKPAKTILLLYSYQSVLPANIGWDRAVRSALKGTDAQPLKCYTEFLDLAQFPDESYLRSLINLLQSKYASRTIDLLMAMGDLAFNFLLAHRDFLFPGVPIVFCAAEKHQVQPPNGLEYAIGGTIWIDIEGTLTAALKLNPQTRRVVLIGGTSKTDKRFH